MGEALEDLATPSAFALSQVCQIAVGRVLAIPPGTWPELDCLTPLFGEVPEARTYRDALVAADLLHRFLARVGVKLHQGVHGGIVPPSCAFDAGGHTRLANVDQCHPESWSALSEYNAWAQAYASGLKNHHRRLLVELALRRVRGLNGESVTAPHLARDLACSVPVLHRQFSHTTGYSLRQYVIQVRVERAIDLLRHTDWKVEVIAREVGWKSKKDLHAAFKRRIGTTPAGVRHLNEEAARDLRQRLRSPDSRIDSKRAFSRELGPNLGRATE